LGKKSKNISAELGGLRKLVRYRKILIPLGVVLLSILMAGILRSTKQEVVVNPAQERVWSVETMPVRIGDERPNIYLFGEIIAGRQANLRSLSAGVVVSVGSNFIDGGKVVEGEKLIAIDPFIAARKMREQEALLSEARARHNELLVTKDSDLLLLHEEQRQLGIAKKDFLRYEKLESGVVSEQKLDEKRLALSRAKGIVLSRQQRVSVLDAQIEQQQAVIHRYNASKERAVEDFKNTQMYAPFDGYLTDIKAVQGMQLNSGDFVARLIDSGRLEVQIFLSNAQFGRMFAGSSSFPPLEIKWNMGETEFRFDAMIERMESQIDSSIGGVHVYARLGPDASESFLRPGVIVNVLARDRVYKNVVRLPEKALYDEDTAYVVSKGRLRARRVTLVGRDGNYVLLRGALVEGDLVVLTRFDGIGEGVAARSFP
jgi:multidrug efflux system membrane fusion protein